ncbi:MAG: prolipoprotein diacylglyceryl transferase [Clostridiaceae bacterium]|jgi:phosphatidylglycerol:prolipoprotein diacylglycerol transferase|nr:prolipoprotein diacylglyceryl transferase [Clostridiaceae bacterium]
MFQLLFTNFIKPFVSVGRLRLPTYGIMMVLAFIIAGIVFYLLAPRAGLPRADAFNLLALILVGGVLGAKVFYLFTMIPYWRAIAAGGWQAVLELLAGGGMVFYGGLLGGFMMLVGYLRKYQLPFLPTLDVAAVALPVGHAIGRLGCFSVGCCYGIPSKHGILMPHSLFAPRDVPLVPTQLIESAFCLLLAVVLYLILRRGTRPGLVTEFYLLAYSIFRFVIEFWRGDVLRGFIGPFSLSQWISVVIVLVVVLYQIMASRRGEKSGKTESINPK